MGGRRYIKQKESITQRMADKIRAIPVYPDEMSLSSLDHKYGCKGLPVNAPIAEDEGWVCFPTEKTKREYLVKVEQMLSSSRKRIKAVRIEMEKRKE